MCLCLFPQRSKSHGRPMIGASVDIPRPSTHIDAVRLLVPYWLKCLLTPPFSPILSVVQGLKFRDISQDLLL